MSPYLVTLIMFGSLLCLITIGVPIAFSTATVGLFCAYFLWGPASIFVLITSFMDNMNNWVLVAVPLFIFMSMLLNKLDIVSDLYDALYKWSGPVPGGLAIATVLVGTVMGAMTGVVAGVVVSLGIIALPQMLKHKYSRSIPMGAVMAAGSLAQLVPPSLVLVIYGAMTQISVGALFAAGITCGLLFSSLFCIYIFLRAVKNKTLCPPLPPEDRATWRQKFLSLKFVILPTFLILFVLGGILSGIVTPTEGSAIGCLGALICGLVTRRLRWSLIRGSAIDTLKLTVMIMWIAVGARVFGSVFDRVGGHALIIELTQTLALAPWIVLVIMLFILFALGCFLDQTAIIFITAPTFALVAKGLGFDPIWFGMLYLLFMIIGFLTPPFGYALFYLKGVAPEGTSLGDIYKSSLPFVGLQLIGVILVAFFPQIATWLPHVLFDR